MVSKPQEAIKAEEVTPAAISQPQPKKKKKKKTKRLSDKVDKTCNVSQENVAKKQKVQEGLVMDPHTYREGIKGYASDAENGCQHKVNMAVSSKSGHSSSWVSPISLSLYILY